MKEKIEFLYLVFDNFELVWYNKLKFILGGIVHGWRSSS